MQGMVSSLFRASIFLLPSPKGDILEYKEGWTSNCKLFAYSGLPIMFPNNPYME